jgi:hypothetical protein
LNTLSLHDALPIYMTAKVRGLQKVVNLSSQSKTYLISIEKYRTSSIVAATIK